MRSAFTASVRFLATFLWVIAKVIISLIAFVVFGILLSFLFGPLIDATGPNEYWSDIGLGLFAAASMAFMFLLLRWVFGKRSWADPFGPWTDAHALGLRRTVQKELSRNRSK